VQAVGSAIGRTGQVRHLARAMRAPLPTCTVVDPTQADRQTHRRAPARMLQCIFACTNQVARVHTHREREPGVPAPAHMGAT
jgi:hypothetical protein